LTLSQTRRLQNTFYKLEGPFSGAKRLKVLEEENAIWRSFWLSDADPAAYGESFF
jgi:hypothetical protein